ncbi:UNVERIFIED_CONTAM: G-type lectin S-receptor-like serine/threonine-protein kinase [Sesamum radiatum]|uniref:Receptor-like serine/threonine-protein kinase n=1 Tax=Sesamum radiatum TaxID=300843 RepID=A0AAW2RDG0_SESRA
MGSSASSSSSCHSLLFPLFLIWAVVLFPSPIGAGPVSVPSISLNFTASYLQFIDNSGAFLASQNSTFQARITNAKPESTSFYFVIIHVDSNTIVWSANRNQPISESSELRLTADGLTLYNDTGHPIWSTPRNLASVSSMYLLESGNLVLLDGRNNTLWESFDFPTDVLVVGQKLRIGKSLVSSLSDGDLSEGSYRFLIGDNDAMLQWNGMNYWKLSMDKRAFRDTNFPVEYMVMNSTGLYLIGDNGLQIVIKVILDDSSDVSANSAYFRIVKLDQNGMFSVVKINVMGGSSEQEFRGPSDSCQIPFICRRLGVCTNGGSCQCAPAFHYDPNMNSGDCVPTDGSLALPGSCNGSSSNSTAVKYLTLRNDLDYFSNDFADPVVHDVSLSACQNLCSRNCSCLGVFYSQVSGSCYMVMNYIGSIMIKLSSTDRLGYIKTIAVGVPNGYSQNTKSDFPVVAVILLPSSGVIVIALVAILIWLRRRRRRWEKCANSKLDRGYSSSSAEGEMEFVSIPGLPVRFDFKVLAVATGGFKTQIGSGGFGTVYKGTLRDGTDVAVKKITCLGSQGKREFLTEIAVIGKIHHVNLVKLKGFCAHRGQRFLVYEYMNRGSLDRTLFHGEPVLQWNERYEIALGTARGLAYLHSGCEHKIIHCDVKPENILLHDKSQVKISDFGLSKLLSPEQSGLFTTMRGTRGYLAPEWLTSSAISDKTDVYSYGMVLLELIRGKKNSSPQTHSNNTSGTDSNRGNVAPSSSSSGESGNRLVYFPLFALEMHEERRYIKLVDPRLMGQVRSEDVEKLVRVALCCVHEEPNLRPSMSNVVGMLEGGVPLGEPRMESLNFLRFYGRRFTEASTLEENMNSEQNHLMLYRQTTTNSNSSYNSFSYMSSQEVSGPR